EDGIGDAPGDALGEALRIGYEKVIADKLTAVADSLSERFPTVPIVFGHAVLDGHDRIAGDEIGEVLGHAGAVERLAFALERILAALEELGCRAIERQDHIVARLIAGLL